MTEKPPGRLSPSEARRFLGEQVQFMVAEVERLARENERLRILLEDVEPFVGWPAEVPDLKRRIAEALGHEEAA